MQVQMIKGAIYEIQPFGAVASHATPSIEQPLSKYWLEATINVFVFNVKWESKRNRASELLRLFKPLLVCFLKNIF